LAKEKEARSLARSWMPKKPDHEARYETGAKEIIVVKFANPSVPDAGHEATPFRYSRRIIMPWWKKRNF